MVAILLYHKRQSKLRRRERYPLESHHIGPEMDLEIMEEELMDVPVLRATCNVYNDERPIGYDDEYDHGNNDSYGGRAMDIITKERNSGGSHRTTSRSSTDYSDHRMYDIPLSKAGISSTSCSPQEAKSRSSSSSSSSSSSTKTAASTTTTAAAAAAMYVVNFYDSDEEIDDSDRWNQFEGVCKF